MSQSSRKFYVIWFGIEGNDWEEEEPSKPLGGCKRADDSSRDFKKLPCEKGNLQLSEL
jgi:hypothetical protein